MGLVVRNAVLLDSNGIAGGRAAAATPTPRPRKHNRPAAAPTPSTQHLCLIESLRAIGAPTHIIRMVKTIYTTEYLPVRKTNTGHQRGRPLSPTLFVSVNETFHATLAKEFPEASFFVYVDDIAIVTKNANEMHRVLTRVQELSLVLVFQTNPGKIEVYKWATAPTKQAKETGTTT